MAKKKGAGSSKRAATQAARTARKAVRKVSKAAAGARAAASRAVKQARTQAGKKVAAARARAAKLAKSAKRLATKERGQVTRTLQAATKKAARKAASVVAAARKIAGPKGKAAARKAKPASRRAAPKSAAAPKAAAPKAATRPTAPKPVTAAKAAAPAVRKANLDRPRRTVNETHGVPSSLDMDRDASAVRTGRAELEQKLHQHTSTSPALTAGDVDADWGAAESVGDEAPGGDNPTPDQDVVDEIGRALGVEYDDDEELQGGDEIAARDRHRWELDPGSSDDFEER